MIRFNGMVPKSFQNTERRMIVAGEVVKISSMMNMNKRSKRR
jgi:hypothetical protein